MSDTLYPALQVQSPDPAKPFSEWAQVAGQQAQNQQTQAQTALLGQQAQGAAIQNQLAGLNLGQRSALMQMAFGPQSGMPTVPAQSPQSALAGIQPGSGQPINALAGINTSVPTGPEMMTTPNGVPISKQNWAWNMLQDDRNAAFKNYEAGRLQTISELAQQSTPQTWDQNVGVALQRGLITQQQYQQFVGHPELRQAVLNSVTTPEANQNLRARILPQGADVQDDGNVGPSPGVIAAQGQGAAAKAEGAGNFKMVDVTVPDGGKDAQGNPTFHVVKMTETQAAQAANNGGRATSAADYANPSVTIDGDTYAGRVVGKESGSNQSAQSGTSTASGGAQFTDQTWLQQIKQQRPDLAAGKSDAQLLAMKTDTSPQGVALMNQITQSYGRQNAAVLAQAGIPVNAMTLGLAHQFGAAGVARVMQLPQNTPMTAKIVGQDAMDANPQFAGKTVGDVTAQAYKAYGVNPVNFTGAPQQQTQVPGLAGPPVQTPQQAAALAVQQSAQTAAAKVPAETQLAQQTNDITQMGDERKTLVADSSNAAQMNNVIDVMRQDSQSWLPGKFADAKMGLLSAMDSIGQSLGFKPDQSVGDWQTFNKNAMELTRQAVRATSARAAAQEFQMIQKSLPSDTTSPQALGQVFDELQGINDWKIAKAAASANFQGNPAQFEKQWNDNVSVGVFMLNRMSQANATTLAQNLQKTPEGRQQWSSWMAQAKLLHDGNILQSAQR